MGFFTFVLFETVFSAMLAGIYLVLTQFSAITIAMLVITTINAATIYLTCRNVVNAENASPIP